MKMIKIIHNNSWAKIDLKTDKGFRLVLYRMSHLYNNNDLVRWNIKYFPTISDAVNYANNHLF